MRCAFPINFCPVAPRHASIAHGPEVPVSPGGGCVLSTRAVNNGPAGERSLSCARSSARPSPGLTSAMGLPSSAAWRHRRYPEKTCSELPITSNASACAMACWHRSTRSRGILPPKKTTSGVSVPPHAEQSGSGQWAAGSVVNSLSPSGRDSRSGGSGQLCCRARARWMVSRGNSAAQCRQTTRSTLPCRSRQSLLPAFWCRPSTFCVMRRSICPACSSRTRARWAALGMASRMAGQP